MTPGATPVPDDDSAYDATVDQAGRLLARLIGLRLDPAIRGRLASAVRADAQAHQLDLAEYAARLDDDAPLAQGLVDRVTVQESAFFRDAAQFDALRDHVLPGIDRPLLIWSAGCANGQEAYSLAIALAESGVADWEVVATDVSVRALERARRAQYTSKELTGLSAERRARFLVPCGPDWEISAPLRRRVRVLHHNLVADPPPFSPGACEIVLCRNVLIYIRPEDLAAFVQRLARWMASAGWLFLGYSESLMHLGEVFRLHRVGQAFAYRRLCVEVEKTPPPERGGPPRRATRRRDDGRARVSAVVAPDGSQGSGSTQRPAEPPVSAVPLPGPRPDAGPEPRPGAGPEPRPGAGPEPPSPARMEDIGELLAQGEATMHARDFSAAVRTFRRCAFLYPDLAEGHLHLGLALEELGDAREARRAFAAARSALARSGTEAVEQTLEGYRGEELVRLLDAKLAGPARRQIR